MLFCDFDIYTWDNFAPTSICWLDMSTWTVLLKHIQPSIVSPTHILVLSCIVPSVYHIALSMEGDQEEVIDWEHFLTWENLSVSNAWQCEEHRSCFFFSLVFYPFRHSRLLDFGTEPSQLLKPSMMKG